MVYPKAYDGKLIYTGVNSVAAHTGRGIVIEDSDGFRIEVITRAKPLVGDHVDVSGWFNKEGFIECEELRHVKHWRQERLVMFLSSALAVIIVASLFFRYFKLQAGTFLTRKNA